MSLTLTPLVDIPLIQPGDLLADILVKAATRTAITLTEGDIFIVAQKIVSKAENRLVNLTTISPGEEALSLAVQVQKDPRFVQLVLNESRCILRAQPGILIVEHLLGFVCANAGIDHSNIQGPWGNPSDWVLLLPSNPESSACKIRDQLYDRCGQNLGVLIIDSHGRAWRNGVVGISIGFSGIPGLVDLRGQPDLFGYNLRITQIAVADELAAAGSLMMGQAAEGLPAVHARGFPYSLRDGSLRELIRPKDHDLFR